MFLNNNYNTENNKLTILFILYSLVLWARLKPKLYILGNNIVKVSLLDPVVEMECENQTLFLNLA